MEDFVTFEISKRLKEKGFPMVDYIPTIYQGLKWLREEKKLHINIGVYPNGWNFFCCSCEKHDNGKFGDYNIYESLEMYNSYELAAIAGIKYALDNLI